MSPAAAWAFSVGTSVGWGSLVVTSNTYLVQAGPMGSVLGLLIGALVMLVIGRNYAYLMRCYPDAGGAYVYTREIFGYDPGFLTAWFLAMTYFAILGANATSLPVFSKIFLGDMFRFVKLYTIFDYDVYLGEALLSMAALVIFGLLCARQRRLTNVLMVVMALMFTVGIGVCFIGAVLGQPVWLPAFAPDTSALSQVVRIAVISPWAYIGFESISHSAEEFSFERSRVGRVLLVSIVVTLLIYIMVTLLSVTAYPARYGSWLQYIRDLSACEGLEALPAFYAADHYLGATGVTLLMLSLLTLVMTSLFGNITALSRLLYRLSRDHILPERFGVLNDVGIPARAVALVVGISCLFSLVGRTAIGWIVDVTTIGATLVYGLVAACAVKMGQQMGEKTEQRMGIAGVAVMAAFLLYVLIPNLAARGFMASETYFLFILWTVMGFLFFRSILRRDEERRFGVTAVVWITLLALVMFIALIWMRQSMLATSDDMLARIQTHYGPMAALDTRRSEDARFMLEQVQRAGRENTRTVIIAAALFLFSVVVMLTNHSYMNKRSKENEMMAFIDPLTGVKSKRAYLVKERELNQSLLEGRGAEFSIIVCDVNGLKQVNDNRGHKVGDDYLREACKMICDTFQHCPVYRVGGDEFVAVATGRDYAVRRQLLSQLRERSAANAIAGGAVVSSGLSDFLPGEDVSVRGVFERADALMYQDKKRLRALMTAAPQEESMRHQRTTEGTT